MVTAEAKHEKVFVMTAAETLQPWHSFVYDMILNNNTWSEITTLVAIKGVTLSGRTLRREMRKVGIVKRENIPNDLVEDIVEEALLNGTKNQGYRTVALKLRRET